jgi:hypothetical protein
MVAEKRERKIMVETLKDAKRTAQKLLTLPSQVVAIVQNDNGEYEVLDDLEEIESCNEQVVETYEFEGDKKVWNKNENFVSTRIHPLDEES